MSSTYKGDSPGKKITRMRMWHQMFYFANWLDMKNEGILVLAGDGGDLSALDGWGIDHDKIVAVDMEKDSVEKCRERFPGMQVMHGKLGAVVKNPKVKYNMAHVDFCGGLSMPNINTLVNVINNADKSQPLILSITMLKGREYKRANGKIVSKLPRSLRKRYAAEFRRMGHPIASRMMFNGPFEPMRLVDLGEKHLLKEWNEVKHNPSHPRHQDMLKRNAVTRDGKISYLGTCVSRMEVLRECLMSRMIQEEAVDAIKAGRIPSHGSKIKDLDAVMGILGGGLLGYHSKNGKQHGTPFVTMTFVVAHGIVLDLISGPLHQYGGESYFNTGATTIGYHRAITAATGQMALKPFVSDYAKLVGTKVAAKVFDLPRGTVAAWLAHRNMGSYDHLNQQLKESYLSIGAGERTRDEARSMLEEGCEDWGMNFGPRPGAQNLREVYATNAEIIKQKGRSSYSGWDVEETDDGLMLTAPRYSR